VGIYNEGPSLTGENVTSDNGLGLVYGEYYGETIALTNCLITGQPLHAPGLPVIFQTNSTVVIPSPTTPIYQVVGGGSYYLTNGSPYRNCGNTNISPALLAELAQKTTYPPLVFAGTNITDPMTLTPQVQRDDSYFTDLGYHYDPLDYLFGDVGVGAKITFAAGTAAGWFPGDMGVDVENNSAAFSGTATFPCIFANFATVQENSSNWNANNGMGSFRAGSGGGAVTANFTRFSNLSGGVNFSVYEGITVQATDCEFLQPTATDPYLNIAATNCLFYRSGCPYGTQSFTPPQIYRNCTFYGGQMIWNNPSGQTSMRDCAFDGTTFDITPPWTGSSWDWTWLDADYNAINNVTFVQEADLSGLPGFNNVYPTGGINWQPSWFGNFYLPPDSPLINAGDRTADQIGLYHFTTQTNQVLENNSIVDIGYHYVATDQSGNPLDTIGDGIPDYIEDTNGNGIFDSGDLGDWLVSPFNGLSRTAGLRVFTPLK
jgi:hypothetical protein